MCAQPLSAMQPYVPLMSHSPELTRIYLARLGCLLLDEKQERLLGLPALGNQIPKLYCLLY